MFRYVKHGSIGIGIGIRFKGIAVDSVQSVQDGPNQGVHTTQRACDLALSCVSLSLHVTIEEDFPQEGAVCI